MSERQYEAMFLFDSGFAADLSKAEAEIKRILDRAKAEIVFCRKWDERRLAYEIGGRRRGTYVLTYFKCRPDAITGIERDARLAENILRLLVLRADHVSLEQMNEFAPEKRAETPPPEVPKPLKTAPEADSGDKGVLEAHELAESVKPVAFSASSDDAGRETDA